MSKYFNLDDRKHRAKVYAQRLHETALKEGFDGLSTTTLIYIMEAYIELYNGEMVVTNRFGNLLDEQKRAKELEQSKVSSINEKNNKLRVIE